MKPTSTTDIDNAKEITFVISGGNGYYEGVAYDQHRDRWVRKNAVSYDYLVEFATYAGYKIVDVSIK